MPKKRSDGRYQKKILVGYDENGKAKHKLIYAKTLALLDKKAVEFKSTLQRGIIRVEKNITVEKWSDKWLKTYKTNVATSTYKTYNDIINKHILPPIGELQLSKVNPLELQNILNDVAKTKSQSLVKKIKILLQGMFAQALRLEFINKNPASDLTVPKTKPAKKREAISKKYMDYIKEFCKTYRDSDFILTLLYTGLRRGELVALDWGDIDFENNTITINKSAELVENKAVIKSPKTEKGNRTIPLLVPIQELLFNKKGKAKFPVFLNKHNKRHTLMSIKRLWDNFLLEFNEFLKEKEKHKDFLKLTMHQFRHTYASILYQAGVDMKTAQTFLGHSSISVTMDIYTHIEKELKQINADKLNEYLS